MSEKVKEVAKEEFEQAKVLASDAVRSGAYLYPLKVSIQDRHHHLECRAVKALRNCDHQLYKSYKSCKNTQHGNYRMARMNNAQTQSNS